MERRLAAILAADVVGYSKLMAEDEEATLAQLKSHRADLFDPKIAEHNGRIIKLMGDGTLAEFASVVDAVNCAIAIQSTLAETEDTICLRIGINLGDIIVDGDDIYGDGVNVAARLEALAAPGGICISAIVRESLGNRVDTDFADAGEHEVKNIDRPIRVFSWPVEGNVPASARTAADKPCIAVLPLNNMSGEPDQEFFADGLTEDIITALSRVRWYDVTARNSTFAYKGASPDIREVGEILGADYVLEGSVRKSGNRARITVQLIEALTGNHIWADRYDRNVDDEFAVQDEIAQRISSILTERIWQDVARNITSKRKVDYGPHDHTFIAIELLHRLEPDDVEASRQHLLKALELAPDLGVAHLCIGFCYYCDWAMWGDDTGTALDKAYLHAVRSQEIEPNDANSYRLLSRVYNAKGMYDDAWQCVERALTINPNDGDIIANRGTYHLSQGEFNEAVGWFDKVLELHPDTPHTVDIMHHWKSIAAFCLGRYEEAIAEIGRITGMRFIKHLWLAACHAELGQAEQAKEHVEAVLQIRPQFRLSHGGGWHIFRRQADRQHIHDALLKAGLPE